MENLPWKSYRVFFVQTHVGGAKSCFKCSKAKSYQKLPQFTCHFFSKISCPKIGMSFSWPLRLIHLVLLVARELGSGGGTFCRIWNDYNFPNQIYLLFTVFLRLNFLFISKFTTLVSRLFFLLSLEFRIGGIINPYFQSWRKISFFLLIISRRSPIIPDSLILVFDCGIY